MFSKHITHLAYDEQILVLLEILNCAKLEKGEMKDEYLLDVYGRIGEAYLYLFNMEKSKLYLDSAAFCFREDLSPNVLGRYFYTFGSYYSRMMNETLAHENFYKAMEFYEAADASINTIIPVYYNLSFTYMQKKDLYNLERIVSKLKKEIPTMEKPKTLSSAYLMLSQYHILVYTKKMKSMEHLDSAILYNKENIKLFENSTEANIHPETMAYIYIDLANNLIEKNSYEVEELFSLVKKARNMANPLDTAMVINFHYVDGLAYFKQKEYISAEKIFLEQLRLMQEWKSSEDLAMYVDLFDMLSQVFSVTNRYKDAMAYEKKKEEYQARIHDKEKYEIIEELQTKYEVNKMNMEIERLNEKDIFQRKINKLTISLCILIFLISLIIIFWFRSRRQLAVKKLRIAKMEKTEVEYQNKIKEQQLEKVELEKYEALLDSHFKRLEIHGKDAQLEELKTKQQELNRHIADYSDKLKEYEKQISPVPTPLLLEIREIINSQLRKNPTKQHEYFYKLNAVPNRFEEALKNRLTKVNIQYCICFIIDMTPEHIARSFSIKADSIRVIRTRIKADLGLDKNDNLDRYLTGLMLS